MKPRPLFETPPFEHLAEVPTHRDDATMPGLERRPRLVSCLHRLCRLALDADHAFLEVDVFPPERPDLVAPHPGMGYNDIHLSEWIVLVNRLEVPDVFDGPERLLMLLVLASDLDASFLVMDISMLVSILEQSIDVTGKGIATTRLESFLASETVCPCCQLLSRQCVELPSCKRTCENLEGVMTVEKRPFLEDSDLYLEIFRCDALDVATLLPEQSVLVLADHVLRPLLQFPLRVLRLARLVPNTVLVGQREAGPVLAVVELLDRVMHDAPPFTYIRSIPVCKKRHLSAFSVHLFRSLRF